MASETAHSGRGEGAAWRSATGLASVVLTVAALLLASGAAVPAPSAGAPLAQPGTPVLTLGSHGPSVRKLQSTLARWAFLPASGVDGSFGMGTWHAVVAFQGWNHLSRDDIVGAATRRALAHPRPLTPWSRATGFEVHISEQVLLLVRAGRVERAIHVSTGAYGRTPVGHFVVQARDALSWSVPFQVWMPLAQYFYGGYAMHEYPDVPAYPASHGCIRVPSTESQAVWRFGRVGMRLWTAH